MGHIHKLHLHNSLRVLIGVLSTLMLLAAAGVDRAASAAEESQRAGDGSGEPPELVKYWDAARRPVEERFPDAMPMPLPMPGPPSSGPDNDGWVEGRLISRNLRTGEITTRTGVELEDLIGHRYVEGGFGLEDLLDRPEEVAKAFNGWSAVGNPTTGNYPKRVRIWMGYWDQNNIRRTYTCSGTLIDSKHVITAGHCVYSHDDPAQGYIFEAFTDSVVVSPAFQNNNNPFRTAQGVAVHSWTGWTQDEDFDEDVGIIELDRPIGAITGWWGYGYNGDCDWFEQGTWTHAGYPAEAQYGFNGLTMFQNVGNFDGCGGSVAGFNMPSYGGSSGSGAERGGNVYAVLSNSDRVTVTNDAQLTSTKFADTQALIAGNTPGSFDLVAMNVTGPATGISGSPLANLSFAAHNYSSASQNGTWVYEVYLSTNSYISQNDIYLGGGSFPANFFPKGTASVVMGNLPSIPVDVASGQYFLGVYLTYNDANTNNNGSHGVDAWSINVSCPGSSVPTLSNPFPAAVCMPLNLTFDWSDLGVGSDYELQIGTGCGSGQVIAVNGLSQYTYYGLQAGTNYFWRVRGKNACGGWGNWSGCWTFSTEQPVAVKPVPISPVNGTHCVPIDVTLAWAALPNVSQYEVQVGPLCGQGPAYTTTGLNYQVPGLLPDTEYIWRVRAKTDCGDWTSWSWCQQIKTIPVAVTAPALILPFDGSPCENESSSLLWLYNPEAASYDVEYGTSCGTGMTQVSTTNTGVPVNGLQGGITYYWRYRMHHECGLISPWTPCYSFTVDTQAPTNPANLASTSHQVGVCSQDTTVDLTWDHAVDSCSAVIYSIVWDQSPATVPDDIVEIEVNFDTSPPLSDGADHWFHLRTFDTADNESSQVLHIGPFCIDTTAPSNVQMTWTSVDPSVRGGYPEVFFQWADATDATSGVVGYSYDFELGAQNPPDATVESAETSATMVQISDASWTFEVRAVDAAGNAGPVLGFGPVMVDSSRPGASFQNPRIGDVFDEGSVLAISWLPHVPVAKRLDPVTLAYTLDAGGSYTTIAVLTEADFTAGEYQWMIPAANTDGAAFRFTFTDAAGIEAYVRSPLFTILGNPVAVADEQIRDRVVLKGNFPNPFNPRTTIRYDLPQAMWVSLRIHDVQGRLVRTLVETVQAGPAQYSAVWNGTNDQGRIVASGVYFYVLETPEGRTSRRMILLK